jgi:hypothetical protein
MYEDLFELYVNLALYCTELQNKIPVHAMKTYRGEKKYSSTHS